MSNTITHEKSRELMSAWWKQNEGQGFKMGAVWCDEHDENHEVSVGVPKDGIWPEQAATLNLIKIALENELITPKELAHRFFASGLEVEE